jgi:hypothetical protein
MLLISHALLILAMHNPEHGNNRDDLQQPIAHDNVG